MLELPKKKLVRQRQQVRNPGDDVLIVWLEPWADRFELAAQEALDIVFVGPDTAGPEVLPYPSEIVVYGWEGAEVVVLQNGCPAGNQPAVAEIIRQEFEIATDRIRRTEKPLPAEEIELVQHKLEFATDVSPESQEMACELASYLIHELALTLEPSDASATVLWHIADRVVNRKALVLAAPNRRTMKSTLWTKGQDAVFRLICGNAISVLPGPANLTCSRDRSSPPMPRRAESESGPTPR